MSFYASSPESSTAGSPYESAFSSRPPSTSSLLGGSYSQLAKLRQDACRGFETEDDNEFCPALTSYPVYAAYPVQYSAYPVGAPSPTMSPPTLKAGAATSPGGTTHLGATPQAVVASATFQAAGHQRKALDIIDPATGLRVGRR